MGGPQKDIFVRGPQKVNSRQMFVLEGYLRGRAPEGP